MPLVNYFTTKKKKKRNADDTTLMAESIAELKSLLIKVKEEGGPKMVEEPLSPPQIH